MTPSFCALEVLNEKCALKRYISAFHNLACAKKKLFIEANAQHLIWNTVPADSRVALRTGSLYLDKTFFTVTVWCDRKRVQRKAMRGRQGQSRCGFIKITVITKVFSSAMYVGAQLFIEYLKYITCFPENDDSKLSTGRKAWGIWCPF